MYSSALVQNSKTKNNLVKRIGRLITRILAGAILIFLLNAFGTWVDFHLPINPVTATVVGLLGFPGLALLILVKLYLL